MSKKEKLDKAFIRVIDRISDGLDNAACVAIAINLDRKHFLEASGRAFDFIKRWHDKAQEEAKNEN